MKVHEVMEIAKSQCHNLIKHKKTGGIYTILCTIKYKDCGAWHDGVLYGGGKDGVRYCRASSDFEGFSLVEIRRREGAKS